MDLDLRVLTVNPYFNFELVQFFCWAEIRYFTPVGFPGCSNKCKSVYMTDTVTMD